jgi:hypothetical protein
MRAAAAVAVALCLAACNEVPQDAVKPYAGKEDTKAYAGDRFKGDKVAYEKALADRSKFQNEYEPTRAAGKP